MLPFALVLPLMAPHRYDTIRCTSPPNMSQKYGVKCEVSRIHHLASDPQQCQVFLDANSVFTSVLPFKSGFKVRQEKKIVR